MWTNTSKPNIYCSANTNSNFDDDDTDLPALLSLVLLAGRNRLEVDDGDENASTSSAVDIVESKSRVVALPMQITAASEANGDVVLPMIHFITTALSKRRVLEHICTIARPLHCKSKDLLNEHVPK